MCDPIFAWFGPVGWIYTGVTRPRPLTDDMRQMLDDIANAGGA